MDIWTAPVGRQVDLGELPARRSSGGLAELELAGRVLDMVAGTVAGEPDTRLESVSWYPPAELPATAGPDGAEAPRLRLTLADRSTRSPIATLRLHSVDTAGRSTALADIRYRRGAGRTPSPDGLLTVPVRPGDRARRHFEVGPHMLTGHVPDAPAVLTTPTLVGLIEDTAADVLRPRFAPGAASVGTWIGVRHTGAATLGERVEVSAVVADVRGRRILFDVWAWAGGRAIGDGQVTQTLLWGDRRA